MPELPVFWNDFPWYTTSTCRLGSLVPIIVVQSLFTILLALVACVRRAGVSEAERFVVKGGAGVWAGVSGSGVGWNIMQSLKIRSYKLNL